MLKRTAFIILSLLFAVVSSGLTAKPVNALSGGEFNAGRIIDDTVFFNGSTMSVSDIQTFLNSKVPVCDTNGAQPYGGTTRAIYSANNGYPTPFVCLKDFSQSVPAMAGDSYCGGGIGASTKTAAQIIYDVGQACNVSPKVLLVLLQKEQGLVTDDWPWANQYASATGFGCPDTAACDTGFAGFFTQVYYAARQYQRYAKQSGSYNFRSGQTANIQYNPNTGCGSSAVNIQNQATAGLYNYTPYQPNGAALANLYGTGDSCSAYGNRNFWRLYNDWFGNPWNTTPYAWLHESNSAYYDLEKTMPFSNGINVATGDVFYLTVRARNMGYQTWRKANFHLGTLVPMDRSSPFANNTWLAPQRPAELVEATVPPGQSGTFNFTMKAPQTAGTYYEHFGLLVEGQEWLNDLGVVFKINVVKPRTPYTYAKTTLAKGQSLTKGQYMISQDAQSVFTLLGDGNLMLFQNFRAAWDSQTSGRPSTKLTLQNDGNLVLIDDTNHVWWQSNTAGTAASVLRLQGNGNLALMDPNDNVLWSTQTKFVPDLINYANSTISTTRMYPGQELSTVDRHYKLLFQEDGNLVLYSSTSGPLWSSGTSGKPVNTISLLPNGNIVAHDNDGRIYWQSNTAWAGNSRLALQEDGNLVLYNASRAAWNTETNGR